MSTKYKIRSIFYPKSKIRHYISSFHIKKMTGKYHIISYSNHTGEYYSLKIIRKMLKIYEEDKEEYSITYQPEIIK